MNPYYHLQVQWKSPQPRTLEKTGLILYPKGGKSIEINEALLRGDDAPSIPFFRELFLPSLGATRETYSRSAISECTLTLRQPPGISRNTAYWVILVHQ